MRFPLRVRVVQYEPENSPGRPSQTEFRYRAFFPARKHRKADYQRDGVEGFIDRLSLRTEQHFLDDPRLGLGKGLGPDDGRCHPDRWVPPSCGGRGEKRASGART